MKKNLWAIMAILLAAFAPATPAADVAPDQLVRDVTGEVLEILRTDKDIASGDHKKLNALVEQKVLPHFNFTRMTQIAVGRDWRTASPAQQQQLTDEFRALLVRTYSSALTNYRDQTVEVKPLRLAAGDTDVQVRRCCASRHKPLEWDYWLRQTGQLEGVRHRGGRREPGGELPRDLRPGEPRRRIDGLIKSLTGQERRPVAETARK